MATLFDCAKAFDLIDHTFWLHKLDAYGVCGSALDWLILYSLVRTHVFRVRQGVTVISNRIAIISSIVQASILGPSFF